jgi:hypothetical protein
MKSRTIAIAGTIAALTFASAPVAATAATNAPKPPAPVSQSPLDRTRDATGVRHVDPSGDKSKDRHDSSRDLRDF